MATNMFTRLMPATGGQPDLSSLANEPWFRALYECAQDPVHHAEGNVGIHTEMVLRELCALERYRALSADERFIVFVAALLHDVAKPSTTRQDLDGKISAPGHSRRGAIDARILLWQAGIPFELREHICAIIENHQIPFFLIEDPRYRSRVAMLSQRLRCDLLAIVTEADGRGRVCKDQNAILDNVELFREAAREEGCFDRPFTYPSTHTRFVQASDPYGRLHNVEAYDDRTFSVWMTSGLPGSGKDSAARDMLPDLPVVSLDDIRREMRISPDANQGAVVQEAQARARALLRKKQPFVWNATHLSRQTRERALNLINAYGARSHILYMEAAPELLRRRNRDREHPVPDPVIDRMLLKWEPPSPYEAHEVLCLIHEDDKTRRRLAMDATATVA